jgi:large subunit ribosomal protein L23
MMDANQVIIQPVITEKTTGLGELNKYVFKVDITATKTAVAQAVKGIFSVEPERVNIINVRGKKKRVRYKYGYKTSWKKAIVTLKKGDKIELFES